ncbi:MAG: 16S rRNA (uracil(1498)-N(3))-methyltransferase [Oscillospiraceae bacterium]
MPRFFCTEINNNTAIIDGEDAKHISKVLRCKLGDNITVCDTNANDYDCTITNINSDTITLNVNSKSQSQTEPTVKVRLFQAIPKADKLELIIQKAVELGVTEIIPVLTQRCVARPDEKSMEKKLLRYNRIAYEAAKQCGRGIIPKVLPMVDFKQAVTMMTNDQLAILFYENSTTSLVDILQNPFNSISILIGSEGGFTPEEAQFATENGCHSLSLGKRILRCETAPIAAIAIVMYQSGNI